MKKLMFASMMAVAGLAFGTTTNVAGFEAFAHGDTNISAYNDSANENGTPRYFYYEASDSSTDGSTVKQFGGEDALASFVYGAAVGVPDYFKEVTSKNYLELSTEGGILWRSWCPSNGSEPTGSSYAYALSTAYIDTMVQFTATEDDNDPSVGEDDKLAIWLRVSNEGATTNLCVRAGQYGDGDIDGAATFVLTNAPAINPGAWYRLTVKAIKDVSDDEAVPGFQIFIDGVAMETGTSIVTADGDITIFTDGDYGDLVSKGQIFLSLAGTIESPSLYAVGFKGSGAIDDLVLTEDTPAFLVPAVTTVDFTIALGENVSSVTYTIDGGEAQTTSGETLKIDSGSTVVLTGATVADWYAVDAATLGTFENVTEATTKTVTASLVTSPVEGAEVAAVKGWAEKNGISYADLNASAYKTESYLLGTTELLTAAPTLKITKIEQGDENWTITVKAECNDATVSLANLNGCLKLISSDTLAGLLDSATKADLTKGTDFTTGEDGLAVVTVPAGKKFMKAAVGFAEKAE